MKGTLHKDQYIFLLYHACFFLKWEIFQSKVVEKIKTHIFCLVTFSKKNCAFYKIIWKYFVERGRKHENMAHVHWIPKATNTHTQVA